LWIHASNATRFEQSCRDVADRLRIPGRKDPNANILQLLRDWLHNERNGHWILVFDNVDDSQFFFKVSPTRHGGSEHDPHEGSNRSIWAYFRQTLNGSIIITSRNKRGLTRMVEDTDIITVEPMNTNLAKMLFEKKLGMKADNEDVLELVQMLECMPLAIVQAAAYIRHRAPLCSVKQYLEDFQKSDREKMTLLKHEGGSLRRDEEAGNAILLTWQMTFDHLRQTRSTAADLLSLMSFFDRQGIPGSLLRVSGESEDDTWSDRSAHDVQDDGSSTDSSEELPEDLSGTDDDEAEHNQDDFLPGQMDTQEGHWAQAQVVGRGRDTTSEQEVLYEPAVADTFEEDILTLRDYSLISIIADMDHFEMHRLVQLATQQWLKVHQQHEEWKGHFIRTLYTEFTRPGRHKWARCELIFSHVQSAVIQKPFNNNGLEEWASILSYGAKYAWRKGPFTEGKRMAKLAKTTRVRLLGPEHPATVDSLKILGLIYLLEGKWEQAEKLQMRVLETRTRVTGPEKSSTLDSMNDLAATYCYQGRIEEAIKLQVNVMETGKRVLGLEHPTTLTSMINLATSYNYQRRFEEAESLQVDLMEICKRALGPEHQTTLISMNNLSSTYGDQGRFKEAEILQVNLMEVSKRVLGPEHRTTLAIIENLASTYWEQSRLKEAERLQVGLVDSWKRVLGPEHPRILASMENLASTYWDQEQSKEAESLHVDLIEAWKKVLGPEHPRILVNMNDLAVNLRLIGKSEAAIALMTECVRLRDQTLGPDHADSIDSKAWLQEWYDADKSSSDQLIQKEQKEDRNKSIESSASVSAARLYHTPSKLMRLVFRKK
jgi:tetratricopeptide (TPR) repeat protein